LIPGKDGRVRVAKVKTKNGALMRPLQRLYPLEIPCPTEAFLISEEVRQQAIQKKKKEPVVAKPKPTPEEAPSVQTRFGRKTRKPCRYGDCE
jgi:hypothetical protein